MLYYKIKEISDMSGISVRMLHHYDKIDILKPNCINSSGYRLYTDKEIERLQQILFFKELDFTLQEIKSILDNPYFDRKKALISHKELLLEKKLRLEKIIHTVNKTINSIERGVDMNKNEMFNSFDSSEIDEHRKKYAKETKEKYGDTNAYKESKDKTSSYNKSDWQTIQLKMEKIYRTLANNMDKDASDKEVQNSVHEWRELINKHFYTCTPEIFRGLGELYVNDERFTSNIDKYKVGLSEFLRDAINIYCDNLNK